MKWQQSNQQQWTRRNASSQAVKRHHRKPLGWSAFNFKASTAQPGTRLIAQPQRRNSMPNNDPAPIQSAELAGFDAAWPEIHNAGIANGWRGAALAAWKAALAAVQATPAQPIADVSAPTGERAATDAMVDAWITFASRATYLHHPEVTPYEGTANGDSPEAWHRRYVKAAIAKVLAARAAAPVSGPSEVPNALGYVPSDDILLPFMCLIEDYMSAVDYHGGQTGEKCDAAEAAIRAALIKLAAPVSGQAAQEQAQSQEDAESVQSLHEIVNEYYTEGRVMRIPSQEQAVSEPSDNERVLKNAMADAWQVLIDAGVSPGKVPMPLAVGIRAALAAPPAPTAQPLTDAAWISVEDRLPEVGVGVMVYSPPLAGEGPEDYRLDFDCIDPNDDDHASWLNHNEHYEHFCCVAKPEGSTGPSEKAPYTHWMPLPAAPCRLSGATPARGEG
jgi:hypothetical protein